jgi:hypothetical protein
MAMEAGTAFAIVSLTIQMASGIQGYIKL